MHLFITVDAKILLGLYWADKSIGSTCLSVISSCAAGSNQIPSHAEFVAAFNKFLYVSVIDIAGDTVALSSFGIDLVHNAQEVAGVAATAADVVDVIFKQLSAYKLKSMCNRNIWTEEQYLQAVNTYRNNLKQ